MTVCGRLCLHMKANLPPNFFLIAIVAALTSCGQKPAEPTKSDVPKPAADSAKPAATGITLAVIPKSTGGEFWETVGQGAKAAAAKEGVAMKAKDGAIRGYRIGKQLDAEKPAGEWNTFTTVCDKDTVTILVNGKEVNKATGLNLTEGAIGLQSEGGAFEVKRCTLEPL